MRGSLSIAPPEEQPVASDAVDAIARERAAREADRQADLERLRADRADRTPAAELVTDSKARREVCDLEPGTYVLDASRADLDADPMASAFLGHGRRGPGQPG